MSLRRCQRGLTQLLCAARSIVMTTCRVIDPVGHEIRKGQGKGAHEEKRPSRMNCC